MKHLLLTIPLLFCSVPIFAAGTNRLFVTIDEWDKTNLDQKSETSESLPADIFPAGNWGNATNDIQLSLRFNKPVYTNGEPIIATILVRNISDKTVSYHSTIVAGKEGPVRFIATTEDNQQLEPFQWGATEGLSADIRSGSQKKFLERFDKDYNLTNGTFFVQAYVFVGPGRVYAKSAKVPISIATDTR